MHRPHDVELEHAAKEVSVRLGKRRALGAARVGDQDVGRAAQGRRVRNAVGQRPRVGHVGRDDAMGVAPRHRGAQRGLVASDDRHAGAGARERRRNGAPDAAAAAGHQRVAPLECGHGGLSRESTNTLSLKFIAFKRPRGHCD